MRQRTVAKTPNQKHLRRLFFKIIIVGTLGFLLWQLWDYTKPSNFPIKQVKIFASYQHVEQPSLQQVITSHLHHGFFYLNVRSLKQQLLKLPWVYEVSIKRQWPDTVAINIVEQQAILLWGTQSLINHKGTIFSPPPATFPQELPVIFGPAIEAPEIFHLYKKMMVLLEPLDLSIKRLVLTPQHYWEILLSNDTVVYLKEIAPLNQLELLVNLYRKITADHENSPKSIDLRYNTGLAAKWE